VASNEQMRFHGAMMRQLRNCLKAGKMDPSPDTAKALQYALRLVNDANLRKVISEGLGQDFSIETDMKYIHKAIALSGGPQAQDGALKDNSTAEYFELHLPETKRAYDFDFSDEDIPF
jgi:hypothetical protein